MVKRAAWAGFFDSFVDSAFGGATVVVVPPVVVVFVVVVVVLDPVVVDPVVLPPVVVLVVVVDDAGGVAFLPDPPPVDGTFAALFVDPRPPLEAVLPLAGEPVLVVVVVVFGDWPLPFRAPDSTFGWPPLGALPDFPCAATGAPLTATIAATVANVRKTFIWNPPPW